MLGVGCTDNWGVREEYCWGVVGVKLGLVEGCGARVGFGFEGLVLVGVSGRCSDGIGIHL